MKETCQQAVSDGLVAAAQGNLGGVGQAAVGVLASKAKAAQKIIKQANPLDGTTFTDKVKKQMQGSDLDHNFPSLIDTQANAATVRKIIGGDGVARTKVDLPGEINGKKGNFSWIIEPDKTINHRQFERARKK